MSKTDKVIKVEQTGSAIRRHHSQRETLTLSPAQIAWITAAESGKADAGNGPRRCFLGHRLVHLHRCGICINVDEIDLGALVVEIGVEGQHAGLFRLDRLE